MSRLRIFSILLLSASFLMVSCSDDKGTDSNQSAIPDNAVEFQSSEEVAIYSQSVFYSVAAFMSQGKSYLTVKESKGTLEKTTTTQDGDTTYFDEDTGTWISEGFVDMEQEGNNIDMGYYHEIQFLSGEEAQQFPVNIDAMHILMDVVGNYNISSEGNTYIMDLKYHLDLTYTGLQGTAVVINGNGLYDYEFEFSGQQNSKSRIYFLYTLNNMTIPEEGYPVGEMSLETKRWSVDIVFDGSDSAILTIMDSGRLVNTDDFYLGDFYY